MFLTISARVNIAHVSRWSSSRCSFRFFRLDLVTDDLLDDDALSSNDYSIIFHLAANPDVRSSSINPKLHLEQNILATFNILEYARKRDIEIFVFTSSSTVYGEPEIIPTPEEYPLQPISMYGASKAACEAMICSYANMYGFKAVIYRLANVIGGRSTHGVIYDFIKKLNANRLTLEILGNGRQRKSYIHVSDCIDAMLIGLNSNDKVSIFNVGSDDYVDVITIADIVTKTLNLHGVKYIFSDNGDGRGWNGDVNLMLLDTRRLKALGWRARYNSKEAIEETAREMALLQKSGIIC